MVVQKSVNQKYIVFHLKDEEYVIPIHSIGSIERMLKITRVPFVHPYIKGVINLRGIVIPVIDVKQCIFKEPTISNERSRIIIVHDKDMTVGLIVEAANDVVNIDSAQIKITPESVASLKTDYASGVVYFDNHLYILLDLRQLLGQQLPYKKAVIEREESVKCI